MGDGKIPNAARRNLLNRGVALLGLAGAAGVAGVAGVRAAQTEAAPVASANGRVVGSSPMAQELVLGGRGWRVLGEQPRPTWNRPAPGDRFTGFGELLDANNAKVGEFYATCTCVGMPFGPGAQAAQFVEHHVLNLGDGTITGMGTTQGDESTFAIVGGTGRYEGARGSYSARQAPFERGGDGSAAFVIRLETTA